eukprot:12414355-Karenia_brevis.AAC.1
MAMMVISSSSSPFFLFNTSDAILIITDSQFHKYVVIHTPVHGARDWLVDAAAQFAEHLNGHTSAA